MLNSIVNVVNVVNAVIKLPETNNKLRGKDTKMADGQYNGIRIKNKLCINFLY